MPDSDTPECVAIEVFSVPSEHRGDLLDLLLASDAVVAAQPGHLDTQVLVGDDPEQIAIHARWRSHGDIVAWRSRPESGRHRGEIAALVSDRRGGTFAVVDDATATEESSGPRGGVADTARRWLRVRYHHIAGGNIDRLAALTDGVFAITLTLLVLDLHVPESEGSRSQKPLWSSGEWAAERELLHSLGMLAPTVLTYLMSFLTLGMFWVGAQTLLNHLDRTDRHMTWIQLTFLLGTALLPFSTALLGEFITLRTALLIYWLNLLVLGVLLFVSMRYARHAGLLGHHATVAMQSAFERRLLVPQALYAVAAALCVVSTYISITLIVLLQLNSALAPNIRPFNRF